MKSKHFLLLGIGLLMLPTLTGCGGGSSSSSITQTKSTTGAAVFKITWPARPAGRLIPLAANSINVVVSQGTTTVSHQLVARPAAGGVSTVTFNILPVGTLTIAASALPNADGSGVVQATASAPLVINAGQTSSFSLTLSTTITHVVIAPLYPVWNGRSVQISAAGYDASNNLVLTAPTNWSWTSSAPGVATVTTGTNTPTVTGVSLGTTTLTATEAESKQTTTATTSVITPGPGVTQWFKYQGNSQNTGLGSGTGAAGTLNWDFVTGGAIYSSVAIAVDGTIYVGSSDGLLYAVNPNGTKKWTFATKGEVSGPAIGADGTIYCGSADSNVYAINPDGTLKWSYATVSAIYSNVGIAADGTVYAASYKGTLNAIDGFSGAKKWTFTTGNYVFATPAVGTDGTVYIGCDSPTANVSDPTNLFFAINPDGTKKWSYGDGYGMDSSAAIGSNGLIYIGTNEGIVHALNTSGVQQYSATFPGAAPGIHPTTPAIAFDGTVYFGSGDGHLYAYSSSLVQKWGLPVSGTVLSDPAVGGDGTVYLGYSNSTAAGAFTAINPTGTQKWQYNSGQVTGSSAVGSDGTIYFSAGTNLTTLK